MLSLQFTSCAQLTTDDVQSVQQHIREHIESFTIIGMLLQDVNQFSSVAVEHIDELFQDLEMERRSDGLPSGVPFVAFAQKQTVSKPIGEVVVLARFIGQVFVGENGLECMNGISWING